MIPVSLRFKAFGPYVEEQFIDFDSLGNIFLICGKTGSGKTVILDAISYALYGKSSGGGRDSLMEMRCQLAPNDLSTEIEYVFKAGGKLYKFTRALKYGRTKFNAEQNALYYSDGTFVPFFENPKLKDVEAQAEKLIGLSYDQFRQVIILPQGQFERLLVAKSEEKEDILISLFGTNKWQAATDRLAQTANELRRDFELQKAEIDTVFSQYGCNNTNDIRVIIEENTARLEALTDNEKKILESLNKAKKQLEADTLISQKFDLLNKNQNHLQSLEQKKGTINEYEASLKLSKKAKEIKPLYDELKSAEQSKQEWENKKAYSEKELSVQQNNVEQLKVKISLLNEQKNNYETWKKKLSAYENAKDVYEKLEAAKKQYNTLSLEVKAAESTYKSAEAQLNEITDQKLSLETEQAVIFDQYNILFRQYLHGISGELAKKLKENTPCPVCGSTQHPSPATAMDNQVTDADIKEQNEKIDAIRKEISNCNEKAADLKSSFEKEKASYQSLKEKADSILTQINLLQENTFDDIKSTKELLDGIYAISSKISKYETDCKSVNSDLTDAENNLAAAVSEHKINCGQAESFTEKFDKAKAMYLEGLNNSFESEAMFKTALTTDDQQLTRYIAQYNAEVTAAEENIASLKEQLNNKKQPDIKTKSQEVDILTKSYAEIHSQIGVLLNTIEKTKADLKALEQKLKKYEKQNSEYLNLTDFVKKLRGDTGVSIQRYVLGIMLSSVTAEANRLLSRVHNGRYRLYRTTEASGRTRKAGLELEVYDSHSGERRGVASLSGGEKFLVSLSLSIGLSTVVQAQSGGIMLNSMFIDEGFGTLDSSSVADALSVLSVMKNNNSKIGIISHISALQESITSKIEVVKNKDGSTIKVTN